MKPIRALKRLAPVLTVALLASPAAAQQERLDRYEYRFEDDLMTAGLLDGNIPIIKGSGKGKRVQLLRPRVSFVLEMLKTVERL